MMLPATRVAALSLSLALTASAQTRHHSHAKISAPGPSASAFTDPANLRGERIAPRTGRELPIDSGTLGLQQLLRKLSTRASLMLIVAHPDDEDGGMLTLYSRGLGARVATLTLTRGEGGQNAITGDFEDALGLIRTQELLSADRYFAADQFFGTEVDFGFSKTKEEAFSKWTHERVLYDAVRAVRLYRPLVIAAVFIGGVTDGHGQHQVSGEIAQEVFKAAADPKVFPELTAQGILPWQPLKVYARVPRQAITPQGLFDYATGQYAPARFTNYVTGEVTTTEPAVNITIHEGQTDPLLTTCGANPADLPLPISGSLSSPSAAEGSAFPSPATVDCKPLSYVQFARLGLGLQKTQIGPGVRNAPAGRFDIGYHLYGSQVPPSTDASSRPERSAVERPASLVRASEDVSSRPERSAVEAPASLVRAGEDVSSRPERSAVERPAVWPATALDPSSQDPTFFDGIDTSIEGIGTLAPTEPASLRDSLARLSVAIQAATRAFDPEKPGAIAPQLAEALHAADAAIAVIEESQLGTPYAKANILHELRIKRVQLNDALTLALNLHLDASVDSPTPELQAGHPVNVTVHLATTATDNLPYQEISVGNAAGDHYDILTNEDQTAQITAHKPAEEPIELDADLARLVTRPYFSRPNIEQPFYNLRDPDLRNAPATPPAITAWADLHYGGTTVRLGRIVHVQNSQGDQPVSLIPPASLSLSTGAQVLPNDLNAALFSAKLLPVQTPPVPVKITTPAGWKPAPAINDTGLPGQSRLQLTAPATNRTSITITASAKLPHDRTVSEGFRPVGYPGIPLTNYFTPATDRIVPVDLKLPSHRRIAYLPGTGDAVPEALASINLPVTTLTLADLTPTRLARFDTVILGVRTYHALPELHGAPTEALLNFARNGGNVLVQYQISDFTAADAPYPLALGSTEKVVDETAPVQLLQPNAPALSTPNRITPADFNGWVEERGHGFLSTWDPHYTALTETHDPGGPETKAQAPQEGGLITTQLGRGHWTYCAFALYRQLPEAVRGGFRLFVNLLSLPDTPTP